MVRKVTSALGVLPEQNDRYRIQPWKVNEIKAYKNSKIFTQLASSSTFSPVPREIEWGKRRNTNWIRLREVYRGYFVFQRIFLQTASFLVILFVNVLARITYHKCIAGLIRDSHLQRTIMTYIHIFITCNTRTYLKKKFLGRRLVR